MKPRASKKGRLGLFLLLLPLISGCLQAGSGSAEKIPAVLQLETASALPSTAEGTPDQATLSEEESSDADLSDAPVTPIAKETPVSVSIRPDSPLAEVVKLANSGVEENVLLAFVTNSSGTFNLGSEEIIYLNDLGMPGALVTAMIQHDHMLRQATASMAPEAPEPTPNVPTAEEFSAVPPASQSTPQADDYANGGYAAAGQPEDVSYGSFYDSLAPYGTWVEVAGYGACWQPTVEVINPGWRPYCDRGHWVYTDCGWYWLSDYSWGWAPFHYGRWFRHSGLGWCWSPDRVWGPAWVSWRYDDQYCGWAPLPPSACFSAEVGLTFHGRHAGPNSRFNLSSDCFQFVSLAHLRDRHVDRHVLPREQGNRIYQRTMPRTIITAHNDRILNHGVPAERVASATRAPVHRVAVQSVEVRTAANARLEQLAGDGKTLTIVHPNSAPVSRNQHLVPARSGHSENVTISSDARQNSPAVFTHNSDNPVQKSSPGSGAVIIRGTDHSSPPTLTPGTASKETASRHTVIVIGKKNERPAQAFHHTPASGTAAPHSDPPSVTGGHFSRWPSAQNSQPAQNENYNVSANVLPIQPHGSGYPQSGQIHSTADRHLEAQIRTPGFQAAPPAVHFGTPAQHAHIETPAYASAPAHVPQVAHEIHSAPAIQSHAIAAAPSAPAHSAPAIHAQPPPSSHSDSSARQAHSSSDKHQR